MPLKKRKPQRSNQPVGRSLNRKRAKKLKRGKVKSAREQAKAFVPQQSTKPLPPEPGKCHLKSCRRNPCYLHCGKNPKGSRHEVDPKNLGFAKGYGANEHGEVRFDLCCRHCGELGMLFLNFKDLRRQVAWG